MAGTSDYGVEGLIDMPSARMKEDSAFTVAYARQNVADTYSFNYQALPWLETSFRYNIQDPRLVRGEGDDLRDRSYGVKVRVLSESKVVPELAFGFQDLFGTGVYGAEYIVLNKKMSRSLDLSLGLGWGRLSDRSSFTNPLSSLSSSFERRNAEFNTGRANASDYFSGKDVGLFGGVEYVVPEYGLTFVAEYNSDLYQREESFNSVDVKSPISIGLNWKLSEAAEFGVSWQHGSQLGLRFSTTTLSSKKTTKRPHTLPHYKLSLLAEDVIAKETDYWYDRIAVDSKGAGFSLRSAKLSSDRKEAFVEFENTAYMLLAEAFSDIAKIAFKYLPEETDNLTLSVYETGTYPVAVKFNRAIMLKKDFSLPQIHQKIKILPGNKLQNAHYYAKSRLGGLKLKADIGSTISLFDPDVPLVYQLFLNLDSSLKLPQNTFLKSGLRFNIDNNFSNSDRVSDSVLPHVRSDNLQYLQQGKNGIDNLYFDHYGKLGGFSYYRTFAGILERMYAGVGVEILHQPYRSRFAYGVSLIAAKQRDFDLSFKLREYQTAIGHASIYWATPFYNYDAAIHIGRYLAKDVGATFELNRRFSNGWQVGLFATLTDVPFSEFGEGSFDKGFMIKIPLETMFNIRSRGTYTNTIRPIGRDGGARLGSFSTSLWNKLRASNYDSLYQNLNEFVE